MNYPGKKAAVLGMGRSGQAAAILLASLGAKVTVLDTAPGSQFAPDKVARFGGMKIDLLFGERAVAASAADHEMAILSPGIDPAVPLVQKFLGSGVPVIAELELAYQSSSTPLIAITGTNGKTTTTELVTAMLTGAGIKTEAGGNIGKPYCEIVSEDKPLDIITLEVSSFQLERIEKFRPAVSVWLNFAPDHLDRYKNVQEYRDAKLRIFENQSADDYAVVNLRDPLPTLAAKQITFSAYEPGADLYLQDEIIHYRGTPVLDPRQTHLRGQHNTENLMAALGVGLARGLSAGQMVPGLCAYLPQAHRCELVRELDGVEYINDSKATNLDALEKALLSQSRPVILIAGGKDKGFAFDAIAPLVGERARWVVVIGEMADRIVHAWGEVVTCERADTLSDAVNIAWSIAQPGEVVLFSPGTSSFDMFKSYADRGDQFCALVHALQSADGS